MRTIGSLAVFLGLAFLAAPAQAQQGAGSGLAEAGRQLSLAAPAHPLLDDVLAPCNLNRDLYRRLYEGCVAACEHAGLCSPQWDRWCRDVALASACEPPVVAPPDRLGGGSPAVNPFAAIIAGGGLRVIDPVARRGETEPEACPGPRPANLGCSQICKPCITFVCEDGEWTRDPIDFPDEICEPQEPIDTPSATACPRSDTGFCPAECSICF